ncbi:inositol monophosphatase family protein [Halomarina oriensis]|uniref:fructose-bisphosphatase n=1 Tax=Halomarina oriensis TaxID=671145 RepID=A0A6B0GRI1_9EURY|nr:inositol monophosphatase [Halomarina oriensis]MWG36731.1 inositol monophosphatase [Halomarina oriensis]
MNDDTSVRLAVAERAARAGAAVADDRFRDGIDVETKDGKTDVVTEADRRTQRRVVEVVRETFPDDAIVGEEDEELKQVPESGPVWIIDPIDGTNNFVRDSRIWATSVAAVVDGEAVAAVNVFPALGDTYVAGPGERREQGAGSASDRDATGVTRNGHPVTVNDQSDPEQCAVVPTIWWEFDARDEYAAACEAIVTRFGDMRRYGCAQAALSLLAGGSVDGVLTNVDPNPWDSVAGAFMVEQAGGTVTGLDGEPWRHDSPGLVASSGACHDAVLAAARDVDDRTW